MATPHFLQKALGTWSGTSKLHLSWLPEAERVQESSSQLSVELGIGAEFGLVRYAWSYQGEGQQGLLSIACHEASASMGWTDSWHQNGSILLVTGVVDGSAIKATGSYSAGEGPEWGWRIELAHEEDQLLLKMFNIDPAGSEEWAVLGTYKRTG